jgi:16S rRNA (uracil1498-N3)-methyltransferase
MPQERFYIDDMLTEGAQITLTGDELHHLKVMRPRPGEKLELINGQGYLASAAFLEASKEKAHLKILTVDYQPEEKPEVILLQALPRSNRLDTILEKVTELGVTKVILFSGEKSEKDTLSLQQQQRAKAILVAATKQSGRLYLPKLELLVDIDTVQMPPGVHLFGDIRKGVKPLWKALSQPLPDCISICIGPEAGLTDREIHVLENKGFQGVSLHTNILRTDTAPISALAIIGQLLLS